MVGITNARSCVQTKNLSARGFRIGFSICLKWMPRRCLSLAAFFLVLLSSASGFGSIPAIDPRNVDASAFGKRVDLSSTWLFAPGDNVTFSSPTLDDSHWKVISAQQELSRYGFRNLEFCWYRQHIHLPPDARHVVLEMEHVLGRYQIFVNGRFIGGSENLTKHTYYWQASLTSFAIPDRILAASHGRLVLAIRFSVLAVKTMGGNATPLGNAAGVYLASREAGFRDASYAVAHLNAVPIAFFGLTLLVGFVSLSLDVALPSRREYLVLAINLFSFSAFEATVLWENIHASDESTRFFSAVLAGVGNATLIEFVRLVLRQRRTGILTLLAVVSFFSPIMSPLSANGLVPFAVAFAGYFIPLLIIDGLLPLMLIRAWRTNIDARLLLPAILMQSFSAYYSWVQWIGYLVHVRSQFPRQPTFHIGSYQMSMDVVFGLAFIFSILLFVVLRTVGIARERARIANEIQAAQTMQQFLLTRASQATPGFEIETVYHPASELGGDFFFILPTEDGSLTAIIGDVSGKGLLAAVRVSMILGVLRREESRNPTTILSSLNKALLIQGEPGFTTACCVQLRRDGFYTVANAGHIGPYVDGCEIETVAALPLGIVADQEYSSTSGFLPSGKKLVLLSDGVVEARSAKGELYGFDRLQRLTCMPAYEIADVAQRFGQQDDITVLTLAICA